MPDLVLITGLSLTNMTTLRSKRVLFLIESLAGGGAEKVLSTMVRHLDPAFFDVTVCALVGTGVYVDEVKEHVCFKPVIKDPTTLLGKTKYWLIYKIFPPRLSYLLFIPKGNDVEIAFTEGFSTRLMSCSVNKKSRKIAWVHTDLENNHWTLNVYKNQNEETDAYKRFDEIVCVSETVKDSLRTVCHGLENLLVLYNPVDSTVITRLSMANNGVDSFHVRGLRLISLGRLVPQKGYDRLLPILKRLHDERFNFTMIILGEGPERPTLEKMMHDWEMDDYVSLTGFLANPYPYLAASDLFVCPSRSEGYSTAVTEALILGVPVLTTNCSGMTELLDGGKLGCIVDNRDEAIYTSLKALLSDPSLLKRYSDAVENASSYFSIDSLMLPISNFLSR